MWKLTQMTTKDNNRNLHNQQFQAKRCRQVWEFSQPKMPALPQHQPLFFSIDPQLVIVRNGTNRIVDFPIPQSRELIKRNYPWERMSQLNYRPLSQEFVKSKLHEFWQAVKKAKSAPFNPQEATVLPMPKLPK